MGEAIVFEERDENCKHEWVQGEGRSWDRPITTESGETEELVASYFAQTRICKKCGREEMTGGDVSFPLSHSHPSGEYTLEPDGSLGMAY